jgi:hypothetical protein
MTDKENMEKYLKNLQPFPIEGAGIDNILPTCISVEEPIEPLQHQEVKIARE